MMKKITLFVLLLVTFTAYSQTTPFTTTFSFIGIAEGYDHICKTQVWVDGAMLGESGEVLESAGGSVVVNVPFGEHQVRIINLAQYEGIWEEHTIENQYSIDCFWEGTYSFTKKKANIYLLFDIDDETKVSWKKMPKKSK
jgi:hypothetical protein